MTTCTKRVQEPQPVFTALGAGHLDIGVITRAERRHEHLTGVGAPGSRVGDRESETSVIDEELFFCQVELLHRQTGDDLPVAVMGGESRVLHAFRVLAAVLLPEQKARDPFSPQFTVDLSPIWPQSAIRFWLFTLAKEQRFELQITQLWRERPGQSSSISALQVVLHGTAGHVDAATDVSVAVSEFKLEPKNFPYVPHSSTLLGHPSGCRWSLVCREAGGQIERAWMANSIERRWPDKLSAPGQNGRAYAGGTRRAGGCRSEE